MYIVWMKKYLFGLLVVSILGGWYTFAGDPCDYLPYWSPEFNDCQAQQQQTQQQYQQNTTADPCLTLVSPSIWWWACSLKPDEDKKKCFEAGAVGASSSANKCSTRYSCETLFTDSKTANACNFARCENQRWKWSSYCTCKYGANGDWVDAWIPLNTSIPFLWNCLKKTNPSDPNDTAALNAFPTIISVASRILVTIIMLAWFIMIVVWWVQWSAWNAKDWKAMIKKVAIWFALLWAMWAILRLINPNFFK